MPFTVATADDTFAQQLNDLLVSTFHSIERYEERSLRAFDGLDLSVNEAHVIDAVGHAANDYRQGITVTSVAEALDVRVPTATAAVNRLVSKGLLVKERSASDGRSINVRLTAAGRRAFRLHELFHRRMVDAVAGDLTASERTALAQGIRKLKAFFNGEAASAASQNQENPAPQSVVVCKTANDAPASAPVVQNGHDTFETCKDAHQTGNDSMHHERED